MQLRLLQLLKIICLLLLSVAWNEFGYHYYQFYLQNGFKWPRSDNTSISNYKNFTRILIIADTHIMGSRKSNWLDKWRREWVMQQAFKIANSLYKPDMIIFLGDILDEGSFSQDSHFYDACRDFDRIFKINESKQKRIVIVGNHDVGFHDHMTKFPYVLYRFATKFDSVTNIELAKFNNLNIVSSNSMSFYDDECNVCSESITATNQISRYLDKERNTNTKEYTEPILLTHIPLYRKDDADCDYPTSKSEIVKEKNIEGKDVLHKKASEFLIKRLRPRLVISGHTHMNCRTRNKNLINGKLVDELTVTSFNHKYAERSPGFLLLNANSNYTFSETCHLLNETIVATIYIATLIIICSIILTRQS